MTNPPTAPDGRPQKASVLLFAGKGGVGKSTVAAATAVRAARLGLRTRLISTDRAHSLTDVLGIDIGDESSVVEQGLTASEPDLRRQLEADWEPIRSFLASVATKSGVGAVHAEEVMALPGLDEVFALTAVVDAAESSEHDLVVVDCAPTAETLRMLALPEVLEWWLGRLRPLVAPVHGVVGASFEQLTGVVLPGLEMLDALERVSVSMRGATTLLTDTSRVGVRLVCTPNTVVTAETRRLHSYLSLFGSRVDAVVVNQLLAPSLGGSGVDDWRAGEAEELASLVRDVAPVPVFTAHRSRREVRGPDALEELALEIYGEEDPTARHSTVPTMGWELDEPPSLWVDLPLVERGEVGLARVRSELVVTVGPYRRHLALLDSLVSRPIASAKVVDGRLRVSFASPDA